MRFDFLKAEVREQKMVSWASVGFFIFVSAFFWAPSRDGLQGVYLLSFFIPMLLVLLSRRPNFQEYGGWMTVSALIYAGYSALSSLWGKPGDLVFFILQWFVLAVWLCGTSLLCVRKEIDVLQYQNWFVVFGVLITLSCVIYHYGIAYGKTIIDIRLWGWNAFRNPNDIGAMSGVVTLLAINIALHASTLKRAALYYFMAALSCVGVVASYSRGALGALMVMFFIALLIVRPPFRIWVPPIFIGVAVIVSVLFIFTDASSGFDGRSVALEYRKEVWQYVFNDAPNHFYAGIGMAKNTNIAIAGIDTFDHAHSALVDVFYRTGLVGVLLSLISLATVVKHFSRDSKLLPLYLWLAYGCLCRLVDSRCLFWQIDAKWFLYWLPLGLIISCVTAESIFAAAISEEK